MTNKEFEKELKEIKDKMMKWITFKTNNKDTAEDIFQEASLKVWMKLSKVNNLKTYLYFTVNSLLKDMYTERNKEKLVFIGDDYDVLPEESQETSPYAQPEVDKDDVICFYRFLGCTVQEIADEAGVSKDVIKSRLKRYRADGNYVPNAYSIEHKTCYY